MKFVTISDVHIKNPHNCSNHELFLKFLNSIEVQNAEAIYLLGDIFDIMVGNHKEYISYYAEVFSCLKSLSMKGKSITYIEGNHDFHIVELINNFSNLNNLKNFKAISGPTTIEDNVYSKRIYLGHGDEIEIDNPSYKALRFVLRSWPVKFIFSYLLPFRFIHKLGKSSSAASRNRNDKMYQEEFSTEKIKQRFRESAEIQYQKVKIDFLICGHSHVKDMHENKLGFCYVNNGYVPVTKSFIEYNEGLIKLTLI